MSMINRLRGFDDAGSRNSNPFPNHQFTSAVEDYARGGMTEAELKSEFAIVDGTDLSEWEWLRDKYNASADKDNFLKVLRSLSELIAMNIFYTTKASIQSRINGLA